VYRYWHLSRPSPELEEALADGWLRPPGVALDLGCGLGEEAGRLARAGFRTVGIDRSLTAVSEAAGTRRGVGFVCGDVAALPVSAGAADVLLDRGCLHYLAPRNRIRYEQEARRVLRPGGRFLLRACLFNRGRRNDLGEGVLRELFAGWSFAQMQRRPIPGDTRDMPSIVARLERSRTS
jgi:SAM-dependent methyltransferase